MSEPPKKKSKKDQPKPIVVDLTDINPDTFAHYASNVAFEGKVISATAFTNANQAFSFVLAPKAGTPGAGLGVKGQRRIDMLGEVARGAGLVVKAGQEVILLGRGGVCEEVGIAKGKGKGKAVETDNSLQQKKWKVVYRHPKRGVHLWIRNTESGLNDHYTFPSKHLSHMVRIVVD